MTAATFILMYKQPATAAAAEALKFFAWSFAKAPKDGRRTSITCRCPARVVGHIKKIWASDIKDAERQGAHS